MNIKIAILSIITSLTLACQSAGLYIVSGGDFRTPFLTMTLNVTDISKPVSVLFSTRSLNKVAPFIVEIDDGSILTNICPNTSFAATNMTHQFSTLGYHKIKVFDNDQNPQLRADSTATSQIISIVQRGDKSTDNSVCFSANLCSNLVKMVIKDGVNLIPANCFKNAKDLTEIIFPDSVISIGRDAFNMNETQGMSKLTTIRLPRNPRFTTIEPNTFFRAKSLDNLVIPPSVKTYSTWSLYENDSLKTLTLGVSTSCADSSFMKLNNLTTVNYYGTLEQWKSDQLSTYFGTTSETPDSSINTVTISGGSAVSSKQITLNFNYPFE